MMVFGFPALTSVNVLCVSLEGSFPSPMPVANPPKLCGSTWDQDLNRSCFTAQPMTKPGQSMPAKLNPASLLELCCTQALSAPHSWTWTEAGGSCSDRWLLHALPVWGWTQEGRKQSRRTERETEPGRRHFSSGAKQAWSFLIQDNYFLFKSTVSSFYITLH